MKAKESLVPTERIQALILMVRGHKVLLDRDLAVLYGVETRVLNQAVRRNRERFPSDFMFELTRDEIRSRSYLAERRRSFAGGARILFPPEKREYELVYYGKEREEDILADTMVVPLQPVRTFGKNGNGDEWQNMLIFGDNLQVMKSLLEMKKAGKIQRDSVLPFRRFDETRFAGVAPHC
jgi:hypothetical protein